MDAGGPEIAANSKRVPKLVSMKIQDGRGRGAPSHSSLDVFDAASVADEERLTAENGNFFCQECTRTMPLRQSGAN